MDDAFGDVAVCGRALLAFVVVAFWLNRISENGDSIGVFFLAFGCGGLNILFLEYFMLFIKRKTSVCCCCWLFNY